VTGFPSTLPLQLCLVLLLALVSPAFAQTERAPMSETQLRSLVSFADDDTLKYAVCKKASYPTCSYIWGVPDDDDALRVKLGGKPEGSKLMTIFAQANSATEFERVVAVYPDAESVEGLGVRSVWSAKRHQLSLIMADNLVIHVNIDAAGTADPKATAIGVANFLLATT